MSTVARYFDKSKHTEGEFIPGVPLDDISEAQFERFPKHVQNGIDAAPFYRKTPVPHSKAPERKESAEG